MNMIAASVPVLFLNPLTGKPDSMPVEMIAAYLVDVTHLRLEEAAKIATIRDHDAAENLRLSVIESAVLSTVAIPEEPQFLSVEAPSLR